MKLKFNLLASAAALALSSASAFAGIGVGTSPDLLLVVYNGGASSGPVATYTRDLGSISQIGNNNVSFAAPSGSIFSSQMAGVSPSNYYWGVFALNNTPNAFSIYGTGTVANLQGLGSADVAQLAGTLTAPLGTITALDNPSNGYAKSNGEYTGSSNGSDVTNALTIISNFGFGFPYQGEGAGSSLNFVTLDNNGNASLFDPNAALSAFDPLNSGGALHGGYFTLNADGSVAWTGTASVSAVPVPAAALLFGPGLLSMLGIARRRKQA